MSQSNLLALGAKLVHGSVEVSVRATETYDEQVGILFVAKHLKVGNGDFINLLLTQMSHQVVVLRVGGDGTRLVVLLQTAEDMLETFAARHGPVADARLRVAQVGCPAAFQLFWNVWRIDDGIVSQVWQLECGRAIGHVGVGHQDDGSHVLQCHLAGHVGCIKAVCWRGGCNDGHRAFTVSAKQSLQKVGLL